jgi:DNA gyrase/topoisomerase IV subunit B
MSIANKYNKVSAREHVLIRPDTYVGSNEVTNEDLWIYDENKIIKKNIKYNPAFLKIFDEALVNASDAHVNEYQLHLQDPHLHDKYCNTIKVEYNKEEGYISVWNNAGDGIPVEEHPEHKTLVPSMIFGELLTSSNYDDATARKTGGRNGVGIKLCNIFSIKFIVEVVDNKNKKHFIQEWTNNMENIGKAYVKKSILKNSSVKVTFYPDFKRFNIKDLDNDHYNLFYRRVIDIAGMNPKLNVYFNDKKIECNNFKLYMELHYPEEIIFLDDSNECWKIGIIYKQDSYDTISFVNSINTYHGGTHVTHVTDQIYKYLMELIKKKNKDIKITNQLLKDNLIFFINSSLENPTFSSQTKDNCTLKADKFGSKYEPNKTFLNKLAKCGIVEQVIDFAKFKESSTLKKTDGKKQVKLRGIPKLDDANKAGSKDSYKCSLILTEGDSAKTFAVSGLSVIGRDYFGVFPLKGKLLNVREATPAQILGNEEITNLKQIIGLKNGEDYSDDSKFNQLRYGRIIILTDQDSVTGDTPLLLKNNNNLLEIKTIDEINNSKWIDYNTKEESTSNYKIWTDQGWTTIKRVIRHKVNKRIFRVLTHTGIVDVTEDHSLIKENNEEISPKDIQVNDTLLHSFPNFFEKKYDFEEIKKLDIRELYKYASELKIQYYNDKELLNEIEKILKIENIKLNENFNISEDEAYTMGLFWANGSCDSSKNINSKSYKLIINGGIKTLNKYKQLFYDNNKNKKIPVEILNSPYDIRKNFLQGYYDGDGKKSCDINKNCVFDIDGKIGAHGIFLLCKSLGYEVSINLDIKNPKIHTLIITKGYQQDNPNRIKKIIDLGVTEQYVYDLETENHHFQAGVGQIIVHNTDGSHIKGLLMNFIHSLWPSLIKRKKFITSMATPIVKAVKGKEILSFYNLPDYDNWLSANTTNKNWKIKYYKGLGTSTAAEAREYFVDFEKKLINYLWVDSEDEETTLPYKKNNDEDAILLAFEKIRADDRKIWLRNFDKNNVLLYEEKEVRISKFIHSDLIHFSNDDLSRSIPSLVDGFKPSQRKIYYGAQLRGLDKTEVKVAQLAGFVSDKAAYHHGEASLMGAIIGMAQNYMGSNNINILKPNGQFGSRLRPNGSDSASPRYIWTMLEDLTPIIFNNMDTPILNNLFEDSEPIEPEYYMPIIPMILVNGSQGIGTGFSTKVACYNPKDIINNLRNKLMNKNFVPMDPWWKDFEGTVVKIDNHNYEIKGKYEVKGNKLIITELPVGESTFGFKEHLEKMLESEEPKKPARGKVAEKKSTKESNKFLSYTDNSTDTKVYFELEFELGYLSTVKDLDKLFHLSKKYSTNNMHLFNSKGVIYKYDSPVEIMEEYYNIRLEYYQKRKDYQLQILKEELTLISYKVKFLLLVIDKKLIINNKKKNDLEEELEKLKFPKLSKNDSYDYLLNMPIYNLTKEKVDHLKEQEKDKEAEYNNLDKLEPSNIWLKELDNLEILYDKFINKKPKKNNKEK